MMCLVSVMNTIPTTSEWSTRSALVRPEPSMTYMTHAAQRMVAYDKSTLPMQYFTNVRYCFGFVLFLNTNNLNLYNIG